MQEPITDLPIKTASCKIAVGALVLIVNTINAAGDEGPKAKPHIAFWGVALAAVVAALLLVGGLKTTQTAMFNGALPFSLVIAPLLKAIFRDGQREALGLFTTHDGPAVRV